MRVKALTKMYYSRREYQPGDIYDMDDREHSEANILRLLGKIEILPTTKPAVTAPEPEYQTRAVEPEPEPMTTENSEAIVPPRGPRYRRRDMRPQS